MLSAVMMLTHFGEQEAAHRMQSAVEAVYTEGRYLTGDVEAPRSQVNSADAVVKAIKG